ncbi:MULTISPECIES: ABC transporter permease subunit [unclassified Streptomyces]|uniref:ABC transporter permease subunit n=1 Tax=unclassified Streptomyces TaxID=2593676 RepID=UPI002E27B35A|nr:ABC transporter permease subunit [Streptomyces sp. NBC_01423]WSX89473.1 ABC transporter permease subunit [Streptomyces sp. NBC_00891]WSY03952.1 ABC transporter permease subunit [Streptomyces sp. NBC_00890]WSZ05578.1 ABC transporter permease subunit [Streptomyces sp. NBC_00869]WSZ26926.1 ABC transporter permease subunit [Streptomyces sp. NBC_00870]
MSAGVRPGRALGGALLLVPPVAAAIVGPLVTDSAIASDGMPFAVGDGHLFGTDALGRDVLALVLRGGASALGVACAAVALAVLLGAVLGLAAASSRSRWLDDLLMRPVELLLPLPSLLVISVVGVGWRGHPVAVALAVAALNVPAVARLLRAAALDAAGGPVAEAMRLQGESPARVLFGHVGRAVLPVAAADAGTRVGGAVFTVAAANFLGLGLDPTSPDWGVVIAASREALFVQPWAVLAPTLMLVMFVVGVNLLADGLLPRATRNERGAGAWNR